MKHKIYKLEGNKEPTKELIGSINVLLGHLSPNNYSIDRKRFRELLDNRLLEVYLLETDGEIAGMGSLHFFETLVKRSAWIEDVVVHPKHQRKGFGKKLTKHLISQAKKKKVKHIDLTSRNSRVKAHKFYEKLNFKKRDTSVFRLKTKK
jgi:ribosomal protein S18 acetylase RimI-like enzyme